MFIIEVVVCSGFEQDYITLRGVSNIFLPQTWGGRILKTHFDAVHHNTKNNYNLNKKCLAELTPHGNKKMANTNFVKGEELLCWLH